MQVFTVLGAAFLGILAGVIIILIASVLGPIIWSICGRRERPTPPPPPPNADPWPSHLSSRLAGAVGVRGVGMNFRGWTPWGGDPNRNQGHQLNPVVPQYVPARAEWPQKPQAAMTRGMPEGSVAQTAQPQVSTEGEGSRVKASGFPNGAAEEVRLHTPETEIPIPKAQTELLER
jgi:hypothetical protein